MVRGKAEQGRRGRTLTGREISQNLKNFKNEFGNVKRSGSKRKRVVCTDIRSDTEGLSSESEEEEEEYEEVKVDEDELSRWKKRSIFFKLPFWAVRYHFPLLLFFYYCCIVFNLNEVFIVVSVMIRNSR